MTSAGRADELGTIAAPWLAAGLAAPALVASGPLGMALVALGPLLLTLRTGRQGALAATVAVSGALLGAAWSAHGIEQRAADPLAARIGHVDRVRLVVDGQPRPGPYGSSALARLDGHPVELRSTGSLEQGSILAASGTLKAVPPSTGDFDRRTWLARQGVHETLSARSLVPLGRRGGVQGVLDRLRHGARAALQAGGDDEPSRIAAGVALGGTASLSDDTIESFRASGLAHLLAVSGGNIVLLVAAVLLLAWLARLPRAYAHGCAIPVVIAYAA
ncbi:MAG: competence protein ComEC, partial [Gaiellales bacterium]|nr:competence protein ComEC [Gaiellales bacterium]